MDRPKGYSAASVQKGEKRLQIKVKETTRKKVFKDIRHVKVKCKFFFL